MAAQVHQLRPLAIRPFMPFNVSDRIDEPEAPEWIVDATVMRGTVCLLAGPPKLGKSLLLQQLCSCLALGTPWLGKECLATRSIGIFCEDDENSLARRQRDIDRHFDAMPPDYEGRFHWETRQAEATELVEFEYGRPKKTDFWRALWGEDNPQAFVWQNDIQVVVLDSVTSVYAGGINNPTQVRWFVRECHQQAIRMNGAVILNHHPSKADPGGIGGTTQWFAASRYGMSFRRPADYDEETDTPSGARELWGLGGNYVGRKTRDRMHYENGVFVLDEPRPSRRLNDPLERLEMEGRLLFGLRRSIANGALVPADVMAAGSLPIRAHKARDCAGVSLNWLYDAQERLLRDGRIIRVNVGGRCLIRPPEMRPYHGETGLWTE